MPLSRLFESKLLRETRKALASVAKGDTRSRRTYDTSHQPYSTGIYVVGINNPRKQVYVVSYFDDTPLKNVKTELEKEGYKVSKLSPKGGVREAWVIHIGYE